VIARIGGKAMKSAVNTMEPEQVLELQEQRTQRVIAKHGSESAEAATSRIWLSDCLAWMNRWDEAVIIREQVFEMIRDRRGDDDEITLGIEEKFAVALSHVGRRSESLERLEHAASTSARTLGLDHPLSVHAKANLDRLKST